MSVSTRSGRANRLLQWILPLSISVLAIWFIARQIDADQMREAFSRVSLENILTVLGLFFLGQLLRAGAWKVMLGPNYNLKTAFFSMNAGYLLNNILPFRLGEIGRGLLLTGSGVNRGSFMEVFASIMTERVLDVFLAAMFVLVTLPLLVESHTLGTIAVIAFFITLAGMLIAGLAAANRKRLLDWASSKVPNQSWVNRWFLPRVDQILVGFQFFTKPLRMMNAFLLLALSWLTAMGEIYVLQQVLAPRGQLWWSAFVVAAGAFAMALPSAPAGIGVYEAATVSAFALVGVMQSTSIVIAIILHFVQTVISSGLGLLGLSMMGKNLGDLVRQAAKREAKESVTEA